SLFTFLAASLVITSNVYKACAALLSNPSTLSSLSDALTNKSIADATISTSFASQTQLTSSHLAHFLSLALLTSFVSAQSLLSEAETSSFTEAVFTVGLAKIFLNSLLDMMLFIS